MPNTDDIKKRIAALEEEASVVRGLIDLEDGRTKSAIKKKEKEDWKKYKAKQNKIKPNVKKNKIIEKTKWEKQ